MIMTVAIICSSNAKKWKYARAGGSSWNKFGLSSLYTQCVPWARLGTWHNEFREKQADYLEDSHCLLGRGLCISEQMTPATADILPATSWNPKPEKVQPSHSQNSDLQKLWDITYLLLFQASKFWDNLLLHVASESRPEWARGLVHRAGQRGSTW